MECNLTFMDILNARVKAFMSVIFKICARNFGIVFTLKKFSFLTSISPSISLLCGVTIFDMQFLYERKISYISSSVILAVYVALLINASLSFTKSTKSTHLSCNFLTVICEELCPMPRKNTHSA